MDFDIGIFREMLRQCKQAPSASPHCLPYGRAAAYAAALRHLQQAKLERRRQNQRLKTGERAD
jgi:hypothetical protein